MEEKEVVTPAVTEEQGTPSEKPVEESAEQNPPQEDTQSNPTKVQSREDNAKFAQMRHEKEVEKAKAAGDAEGYKRARIKSVHGKNPYSGDAPIETDEDYELYEIQDEIKLNGGDPSNVLEVDKIRRQRAKELEQAREEAKTQEEKDREQANKDIEDYLKDGHTRAELKSFWENPEFQEFADGLIGKLPLKTLIAKFEKYHPKENPNVKKNVANNISSPGSASNNEPPQPQKTYTGMSREEFAKVMKEVSNGKRKI